VVVVVVGVVVVVVAAAHGSSSSSSSGGGGRSSCDATNIVTATLSLHHGNPPLSSQTTHIKSNQN